MIRDILEGIGALLLFALIILIVFTGGGILSPEYWALMFQ